MPVHALLEQLAQSPPDQTRLEPRRVECTARLSGDRQPQRLVLQGDDLCHAVVAFARRFLGPISCARSNHVTEILGSTRGPHNTRQMIDAIANPLLLALCGDEAREIHLCYEIAHRCRIALPRDLDWTRDLRRVIAWCSDSDGPTMPRPAPIDWVVLDYVCLNLSRDDLPLDDMRYTYLAARLKDLVHVLVASLN